MQIKYSILATICSLSYVNEKCWRILFWNKLIRSIAANLKVQCKISWSNANKYAELIENSINLRACKKK